MTKDHAARMRFHRLRKDIEGSDFEPRKRKALTDAKDMPDKTSKKGRKIISSVTDDEEEPLINTRRRMSFIEKQEQKPQEGLEVEQRTLSSGELVDDIQGAQIKESFPERDIKTEEAQYYVDFKVEAIKTEREEAVKIKEEPPANTANPIIKTEPADW